MRTKKTLAVLWLAGGLGMGGCATSHTAPVAVATAPPGHDPAWREPTSVELPAALAVAATPALSALEIAAKDVREAADPDAAVDAYARGIAVDDGSLYLHKTYIRKMVELGLPHLAGPAAAKVVAAEPNAALALTVQAFIAGRDGDMVEALADISLAAKCLPAEPFIQRTAGHLLAWYDNHPRPVGLPSTVRYALQGLHGSLDDAPVFADAYNDAADFYHRDERAVAPGPTTGPATRGSTTDAGSQPRDERGPSPAARANPAEGYDPDAPFGPPMSSYQPVPVPVLPPPEVVYEPYYYEPYYYEPSVAYYSPAVWGWGPGYFAGSGFFYLGYYDSWHHHRRDGERGGGRPDAGQSARASRELAAAAAVPASGRLTGVAAGGAYLGAGGTSPLGAVPTGINTPAARHVGSATGNRGVYLPSGTESTIGSVGRGSAASRLGSAGSGSIGVAPGSGVYHARGGRGASVSRSADGINMNDTPASGYSGYTGSIGGPAAVPSGVQGSAVAPVPSGGRAAPAGTSRGGGGAVRGNGGRR